jgi:transposase
MAYRELGVIELREVWRRYSAGEGVRAIARGTGVDRKTIAKYVATAVAVGLHRGAPPPTDDQLAAFVSGLRDTHGPAR